jgi:hypothetical protein
MIKKIFALSIFTEATRKLFSNLPFVNTPKEFIEVEEKVFLEAKNNNNTSISLMKKEITDNKYLFMNKNKQKLFSYLFIFAFLSAILISTKPVYATMITGTVSNEKIKKFSYLYTIIYPINNLLQRGDTISKVSRDIDIDSLQTNLYSKNITKKNLLFLFAVIKNVLPLDKGEFGYSKKSQKTYPDLLSFSFLKNTNPKIIYSEIEKINYYPITNSLAEILSKEIQKLFVSYLVFKILKIFFERIELLKKNSLDEKYILKRGVRPYLNEEEEFNAFLKSKNINPNDLTEKQLERLRKKWKRWRYLLFLWKKISLEELLAFLRNIPNKSLNALRNFEQFSKKLIRKYPYTFAFINFIIFVILLVLLREFYRRMFEDLIKKHSVLLEEIIKDAHEHLVNSMEKNQELKKLLEIFHTDKKIVIDKMTADLAKVNRKYDSLVEKYRQEVEIRGPEACSKKMEKLKQVLSDQASKKLEELLKLNSNEGKIIPNSKN